LARASRGVHPLDWLADLPPWRVLRLIEILRSESKGWIALTTIRDVRPPQVTIEDRGDTRAAGNPAASSEKVTSSKMATRFMHCPVLFPLTGGFSLSLEVEQYSQAGKPTRARLWVRLSAPPCGPLALRLFLAPDTYKQANACEAELFDLRLELRADVGYVGLRLDGLGDDAAIAALREVVTCGEVVRVIVQAGEPAVDTEGYPGGSGWIPWAPAKPSLRLFRPHA